MKRRRRRQIECPDPDTQSPLAAAVAGQRWSAMETVRRAVSRQDVVLAFQPVVAAGAQNRIAFHEGLIRVLDETGRIVPARDFIGEIEATEIGRKIDCLALDMGFVSLAADPSLRLAINMSARSIGYPRWTETLRRGLDDDPTAGERLILEITESSAMTMPEITGAFMRRVQKRGVTFALDDFGSGHTSFRYLREFMFDIIKIDGQFIRGVGGSADNQVLTRALVSIAAHFDMLTVAEAVETPEEAAFCTEAGIDCLQGYLFGAPSLVPPWVAGRERMAG